MPNKNTFDIPQIKNIIEKYNHGFSIDPFANTNKMASVTNDLIPEYGTDYTEDALVFLKRFEDNSVDVVLYDPPFSVRQVSECYKKMDMSVNYKTTTARYWSAQKAEIGRIVKLGGNVITCGWNSGGIGKKHGFEIIEILLVAHGGWHNDTIVTVEEKVK